MSICWCGTYKAYDDGQQQIFLLLSDFSSGHPGVERSSKVYKTPADTETATPSRTATIPTTVPRAAPDELPLLLGLLPLELPLPLPLPEPDTPPVPFDVVLEPVTVEPFETVPALPDSAAKPTAGGLYRKAE